MALGTLFEKGYDIIGCAFKPSDCLSLVSELAKTALKSTSQYQGHSLHSWMVTLAGVSQNAILVPSQTIISGGANYIVLRRSLAFFVNPSPNSGRDYAVTAIAALISLAIAYQIAECLGYAEVPHLNPGYDSRFISLFAGFTGVGAGMVYEKNYFQKKEEGTTVEKIYNVYNSAYNQAAVWAQGLSSWRKNA